MWSNILVVKHEAFAKWTKKVKNTNPILHIVLLGEKSENWQKILGNVYQVSQACVQEISGHGFTCFAISKGEKILL